MALAFKQHKTLVAVTFKYGQKHETEAQYAARVADYYDANHIIIELPRIFAGTDSVLVKDNKLEMPHMTYEELQKSYGISPTYVPYRNGNLLSMATTVALTAGASEVWAGMHAEDAHNWAYPDCTPEFLGAQGNSIYVGTYAKVRLVTPLQWLTKAEVVALGLRNGAPYELTMSCYEGVDPACGKCPTCVGRLAAFAANGVRDPIRYAE
jgi:7-cyano-7-deazaguanine synthase